MGVLDNNDGGIPEQSSFPINEASNGSVQRGGGIRYQVGFPVNGGMVTRVASRLDRSGSVAAQRNGLLYETLQRQFTRKFNVWTNSANVGPSQILQTEGVPYVGGSYPYASYGDAPDQFATCVKVDVEQPAGANPKFWIVTAYYDTDRLLAQLTDNPLAQPPEVFWEYQPFELPMRYDYFGVPCVSSSSNAFDPPPMVENARTIYRVVRNEAFDAVPVNQLGIRQFQESVVDEYRRKLNLNTPIMGLDGGGNQIITGYNKFMRRDSLCARINFIIGHRMITNGVMHYQVTYEVEFRKLPDTFIEYLLDQDTRDLAGNLFRDPKTTQPLVNPTPLNGRGRPMREAVTRLTNAIAANQLTCVITSGDQLFFPPAPRAANADGVIIGPHYYFYVRIDDEIIQVVGGAGTFNWTITRGQRGTTPAAHNAASIVQLEPYFLRFIPNGYIDFSPLKLDVI